LTNKPIRKAVFPVAGLGTRILPATKSMPKEMLTIVDRPLIQYAMDEAREAGIEHFIFVTGRGKSALEDHFDHAFELEATLAARGKSDTPLAATRYTPGSISYVRQQQPLGLGHAVWCAREMIGNEPFAVLLPDDLMRGTTGCLSQMMTAYDQMGGNIICVQEVAPEETNKYGIIDPALRNDRVTRIQGLVEKPAPADAPSNLAIVGRYIIQPEVLDILAVQAVGTGGEIQLTDAMAAMISDGNFHGLTFDGVRYDCGDKLGFVQANIGVAMEDEAMRHGIASLIAKIQAPTLRPASRSIERDTIKQPAPFLRAC
jgi:UTP--glucose-1-phosphate uridylyltransferase